MAWRVDSALGLTLVRCAALEGRGLAHAFSARLVEDGAGRLARASGFGGGEPLLMQQIHGTAIVRASESVPGVSADGALWVRGDPAGALPAVKTADCVPLLLAADDGRAAMAVHAGWRGTAEGIGRAAIAALERIGVDPAVVLAALGPAIGACCYEVGEDVARAVVVASGGGDGLTRGRHLDLRAALARQLEEAGVPATAIHRSGLCTRCRPDLFFSYRRDGAGTGRMISLIGPATGGLA